MPKWEPTTDPEEQAARRVLDERFLENLEALRAFLRNPRDPVARARHNRAFMQEDSDEDAF